MLFVWIGFYIVNVDISDKVYKLQTRYSTKEKTDAFIIYFLCGFYIFVIFYLDYNLNAVIEKVSKLDNELSNV